MIYAIRMLIYYANTEKQSVQYSITKHIQCILDKYFNWKNVTFSKVSIISMRVCDSAFLNDLIRI